MKCFTTGDLKSLLDEAFLRGFISSTREHNGDDTLWSQLEENQAFCNDRECAIAELLHRDTGGYDGDGSKV